MSAAKKSQTMKPSTAAQKLDVYLPATPPEFRERAEISREELTELQKNPPQWLVDLHRDGPHPRNVVAARLRVSISGLARGGVTEALTSAQITELIENPPSWLPRERAIQAEVRREEQRLRERQQGIGERPDGSRDELDADADAEDDAVVEPVADSAE